MNKCVVELDYFSNLIHKLRETNNASHEREQRPTYELKMDAGRDSARQSVVARPESLSEEGDVMAVGCRERILVGYRRPPWRHPVALRDENKCQ